MLRDEPTWIDERLSTLEHIQKALETYKYSVINMPRRVGKTAALITIALHSTEDIAIVTRDTYTLKYIERIFNETFLMFKDSIGKYKTANNKFIYLTTMANLERGSIHGRRVDTILFDECTPSTEVINHCNKLCCVGTQGSWIPREGYIEVQWEDIKPIGDNWRQYE